MNLKQIIALLLSGKEVDMTKVDLAALGMTKEAFEKLVAETKPDVLAEVEMSDSLLKVKADKLIAAEAQTTRSQLYGTIEELKKGQKELSDKLAAEAKAKEDAAAAEAEAKAKKERENLDAKGAIAELESRFTQIAAKQAEEFSTKLTQQEQSARAQILQLHREKIIAASGGEIIEELLTGNTPEELTASAELARQKFASIKQRTQEEVLAKTKAESDALKAKELAEAEEKKKLGFIGGGAESGRNAPVGGVTLDSRALKTATAAELAKTKDEVLAKFGL
jgi:colicin import membrane protein